MLCQKISITGTKTDHFVRDDSAVHCGVVFVYRRRTCYKVWQTRFSAVGSNTAAKTYLLYHERIVNGGRKLFKIEIPPGGGGEERPTPCSCRRVSDEDHRAL